MNNMQGIQWFPGHMSKTHEEIKKSLKNVDAVAVIIDARIPISSRNPEIEKIINVKPNIILMNKCDIADRDETFKWINKFKQQQKLALDVDCKTSKGLSKFIPTVKNLLKEDIKRWQLKGMKGKSICVLVVGIPNVGKSSFINRMANNVKAKVEDRPGITKKNQFYKVSKELTLLDTPGVLWPKFEDKTVGEHLAITGAIKDEILSPEDLALKLINILKSTNKYEPFASYKINDINIIKQSDEFELLELIALKRGMLLKDGEKDILRASNMILHDFRSGKLGNITLQIAD